MSETDTISRQAALDAIMGQPPEPHYPSWYAAQIEKLPAVQPDHNADVSKKAEGDCISRQVVAKFFNDWISCLDENCHHQSVADMTIIKNDFKNLPSVQPKQVCVATVTLTDEQVKESVEKAKNAVISVIEPEPHWIPCSERLPEYNESVLTWDGYVFCIEKRIPYIRDDDGEPIEGDWWVSDEYDEYESEFYPNLRDGAAIAWMPLPEPYKGGDSE